MFCPNCGTQNSETASTCTKCGFNLKGAAAPKFKGTMLMNQQPGAPAGPPQGPTPGMGVPPPPAALAGTMMGVPPAGMGASASAMAPPAAPPPPAAGGYGAPPSPYGAPPAAGGYAPPGGQPVNPLGGTMAIDQMPFPQGGPPGGYGAPPGPPAAFPPPQGAPPGGGFGAAAPGGDPFGAPPGGGYGAPPGGAPPGGGYGPPPGGDPFGAPPGGGYGAPPAAAQPGGYGAPPQPTDQAFGGAPGGAYGAPPGGAPLAAPGQFGAAMMGGGGGGTGSPAGFKGQTRNPVMTLVISMFCCFYAIYQMWTMLNELQQYTNDQEFKPWFMFIPFLNYYFLWIKVPEQVAKAKQMAGSRNPQAASIVMYLFLFLYALPKDLNEIWDPNLQG